MVIQKWVTYPEMSVLSIYGFLTPYGSFYGHNIYGFLLQYVGRHDIVDESFDIAVLYYTSGWRVKVFDSCYDSIQRNLLELQKHIYFYVGLAFRHYVHSVFIL